MRYQNLAAFHKHLSSAAPDHLCKAYLIAIPDPYERKKELQLLSRLFPHREQATTLEAFQSPSLFGEERLICIDEVDKLSKSQQQLLGQPMGIPLLLGASAKTPLLQMIEKEGVVLDLLEEKPWEKEKRLLQQIGERVEQAGKRLSSDVPPLLLERMGPDAALLDREIDKLLCYIGERATIERSDVFRITSASKTHTLWQLADEIIWEKGEIVCSDEFFYLLVPLLRSQLQLGLKIATLVETKVPHDQWTSHLPKLWPKTLEKRTHQATKKGSGWFQRGLNLLFDIELLSRDGSTQTGALLDLFRFKLLYG